MEEQTKPQQTWVQKNKRFLVIAIIVITIILFALTIIRFDWDWTGLTSVTGPTVHQNEQYRPAKTLWDVLQLLIVPFFLAIGAFWLNQIQKSREEKTTAHRAETEREAAEKRAQTEREIAADNQQEAALQGYIDKLSELLLHENLREPQVEAKVCNIARVRTLTVLPRLDKDRKKIVLQFLYESGLIQKDKPIVVLRGANLSSANLRNADLSGANLSGANLNSADLSHAKLNGADLRDTILFGATMHSTNLGGANLSGANLLSADLSDAILCNADLSESGLSGDTWDEIETRRIGAQFFGGNMRDPKLTNTDVNDALLHNIKVLASAHDANLKDADLSGVNLRDADVTRDQLDKTKRLHSAIMPDGSKYF